MEGEKESDKKFSTASTSTIIPSIDIRLEEALHQRVPPNPNENSLTDTQVNYQRGTLIREIRDQIMVDLQKEIMIDYHKSKERLKKEIISELKKEVAIDEINDFEIPIISVIGSDHKETYDRMKEKDYSKCVYVNLEDIE